MQKILLILVSIICLSLISLTNVYAQVESTPSSKIKVERVANVLDRLKERINLLFKFSVKEKIMLENQLAEKRLAELDFVIRSGQGDLIEEVSSRYRTHMGQLINDTKSISEQDIKRQLLEMGENHQKVLPVLRDNFEANSGLWLLIQQDLDIVKELTNQIQSF